MNKAELRRLVKEFYGPHCDVVSVSHKDRHQRFGIVTTTVLGPSGRALVCLGHGDSWDAALDMTQKNPVAASYAEQWAKAKEDLKAGFGEDPQKYLNEKLKEMKAILEKE